MRPPEVTEERQRKQESLRLALSMRGGVSLAVWIGGSVAEIESLRKASLHYGPTRGSEGTAGVYQRLLAMANYGDVEVDILTGASAGGLNGAIYAASLVYGFDFEEMADVWLELADVESLSRSTTTRTNKRAPSLFDGDGYFLKVCEAKLNEFVAKQVRANAGQPLIAQVSRLDLFLSATRLVATDKVLRNDSFNDIVESRSSAFFHFRHLGELVSPLSDFGADPGTTGQYSQSVSRLAQSGRASSSFPVAFEPAEITSRDDRDVSGDNLFGIFSEIGEDVRIIDGGVLDNIPVAMAIDAIAAAPAQAPTSRWLLYLHPSPPAAAREEPPTTGGKGSEFFGIMRALKRTLTLKFNNESLVEDMVELDRHNQRVSERRSARRGLLETAQRQGLALESAFASWSEADARQVRTLLADPALATMTHPFVRIAYEDLSDEWTSAKRTALDKNLPEAIEEHYRDAAGRAEAARGGKIAPGVLPLIALGDTVEVLLGVAQQVYVDSGEPQRVLYRVRLLVEVLTAIWEQSWLEATRSAPSNNPEEVKDWIRRTAFECMVRSEVLTQDLITELLTDVPPDQDGFHDALRAHYDARVAVDLPRDDTLPPLSELWTIIEPLAQDLVAEAGALDDPVIEALRDALTNDGLGLSWFATACAPLHRRHNDGESEIKFLRVAGTNESPLAEMFTQQLIDGELSVQNKLAGNQVANFGAFFSAQWRANDWMWGQLDTAKSLVDLLADSQRWFLARGMQPAQVLSEIEAIMAIPFAEQAPDGTQVTWTRWLDEQWHANRTAIVDELAEARIAADSNVSYPLVATKRLLVTRLQAELLSAKLDWVHTTGETVGDKMSDVPVASDDGTGQRPRAQVVDYDGAVERANALTAGIDKLPGALDTKRWARIGMRLGFNAWNALAPTGWRRFAVMGLKPVYLFLLAIVAFPRRSLFSGMIGFGVLGVGRWEYYPTQKTTMFDGPVMRWPDGRDVTNYMTWQRFTATAVAGLLAALACYLQIRSTLQRTAKLKQLSAVLGTAALGLAGAGVMRLIIGDDKQIGVGLLIGSTVLAVVFWSYWAKHSDRTSGESWAWRGWVLVLLAGLLGGAVIAMTALGASLTPVSVPIVAVIVVAVGMNWIPLLHRSIIALLAAASYLLTWFVLDTWRESALMGESALWGWWALGSFALANVVATTFVSQVDVFPKARR